MREAVCFFCFVFFNNVLDTLILPELTMMCLIPPFLKKLVKRTVVLNGQRRLLLMTTGNHNNHLLRPDGPRYSLYLGMCHLNRLWQLFRKSTQMTLITIVGGTINLWSKDLVCLVIITTVVA